MLRRQSLFLSTPAATETADQAWGDRNLDSAVCCTRLDAPGFSPSASFLSVWEKACGKLSCGRGKSDELEKKKVNTLGKVAKRGRAGVSGSQYIMIHFKLKVMGGAT